jgi:CubicO group peptidase (beta-lactamase class C family)
MTMKRWLAGLAGLCALTAAAASQAADPPAPVAFGGGGASILMWTPEQQAWGYRNMEKVGPVRVIKRGDHVFPLPASDHPIDPAITYKGKTYTADSYMAAWRVSGLLVIKDGKVVLERYGLGRKSDERWTSFSVAKSMTSTLIGAAIRDGYIKSLDEPVTTYIPELKGSAYEGVTVRQLITMTSGVKWNEDYTDMNSDVAKVGLSILEPGVNPVVSYMRKLPREAPPGTKFVYKTGETDLAGILLSNAVHKPMAEYLSEKIWAPFGMEQDGIWVEDIAGHERGGCCMSMTLHDYGRIGMFMLGGGMAGGKPVLPDGWVADATSPHVKEPPYGYFWWLTQGGYEAEGIFGQSISVFPAEHLVVVQNSAWPAAWNDDLDGARGAMLSAVRAAVK